jgi:DNA-binding CsgD family transcriptional regulator
MLSEKRPIPVTPDSKTYPLGQKSEHVDYGSALGLVALSHTTVEHRLYSAMLFAQEEESTAQSFTARRLMTLTGIRSLSTIRRGLEGLLVKLSIARDEQENGKGKREQAHAYRVYLPVEVISRRKEIGGTGLSSYGNGADSRGNHTFEKAIARIADNALLSRREAQVTLCCVEGLTNAEIGRRLDVSEQTVKFHLRHIFVKFVVKRRAELISRLLT